jgi:hypothetical protein
LIKRQPPRHDHLSPNGGELNKKPPPPSEGVYTKKNSITPMGGTIAMYTTVQIYTTVQSRDVVVGLENPKIPTVHWENLKKKCDVNR